MTNTKRYTGPRSACGIVRAVLAMEDDPAGADPKRVLVAARAYRERVFGEDASPVRTVQQVYQARYGLAKELGTPLTKGKLAKYLPKIGPRPAPSAAQVGGKTSNATGRTLSYAEPSYLRLLAKAEAFAQACGGLEIAHDILDGYEEFQKARAGQS